MLVAVGTPDGDAFCSTYRLNIEEATRRWETNDSRIVGDVCSGGREDVAMGEAQSRRHGLASLKTADDDDHYVHDDNVLDSDLRVPSAIG